MRKDLFLGLLLIAVGIAGLSLSQATTPDGSEGDAGDRGWRVPWGSMMGWGHMRRFMGGRMGGHMGGPWQPAPRGEAPAAVAAAPVVEVSGLDFAFRPAQLRARVGQPMNLALTNRGAVVHDVTIPALSFQLVAQPGQRAVGGLTVTTPGTYEFYCSVPGHRQAGMIGQLAVTPWRAPLNVPTGTRTRDHRLQHVWTGLAGESVEDLTRGSTPG